MANNTRGKNNARDQNAPAVGTSTPITSDGTSTVTPTAPNNPPSSQVDSHTESQDWMVTDYLTRITQPASTSTGSLGVANQGSDVLRKSKMWKIKASVM